MKTNKTLKVLLWNVCILIFLIEMMSMAYIHIKKPPLGYLESFPTYLNFTIEDQLAETYDPLGPHFIDTTYPWATWHPRNSRFRHKKTCFDVIMHFNSLGTRGTIPKTEDTSNILFIGDSFTEGFGLPEDSTLPTLISDKMDVPVLNLGSSGHVGTTQYGLIYDHFSKLFRHREVYVLLFLKNDFIENRINKKGDGEVEFYRPYRSDTNDLARITYTGSLENNPNSWETYRKKILPGKNKVKKNGIKSHFKRTDISFVSKLITLTYTKRMSLALKKGLVFNIFGPSSDIVYSSSDLKVLDYDLRLITEIANRSGARVTFINIPDVELLSRTLSKPGTDNEYLDLERHISSMFESGPHRFLSYYRHFIGLGIEPKSIVFECDNHYNGRGMGLLAEFIAQNWR